ncbi:MAG TPA: caspase family protein [Tenuifilaceae bacterium]|nr:caspase family protein [Tenuifilaceae bacterium]
MKKFVIIPVSILLIFLYSCATILYGRKQRVTINSEPQGAQVYINGENTYETTPCKIKIERKQPRNSNLKREVTYELRKENYNSVEIRDEAHKNYLVTYMSWILYVVPGVVDLATGANNLYQKEQFAKLYPVGQVVVKTDTIVQKEIVYVDRGTGKPEYIFEKKSDVDRDIPVTSSLKTRRFALIIGNEDYSSHQVGLTSEVDVQFARNDASAFKEYAMNVMGIPERNITFLLDATSGQMKQAITKMNAIIKSTYGEAEVFVYYAGHGLPDEVSKEPYLIPVDVSGKNVTDGIKLAELYQKLNEHPVKRVTVFIDACFSGGAREQGLLAARAVKVRPKENPLNGNMIVFTASSGDQSSLPYHDQNHGFFTYFLLKIIKEKGPDVTYNDIATYLKKNVELEAILVNEKEQTPQVNVSPSLNDDWLTWSLK